MGYRAELGAFYFKPLICVHKPLIHARPRPLYLLRLQLLPPGLLLQLEGEVILATAK